MARMTKAAIRSAIADLGALPFTDRASCEEWLAADPKATEWALDALYRRQTANEQASEATLEHNEQGFNSMDAAILTSISEQMHNKAQRNVPRGQRLSPRQLALVRNKLGKYHGQLLSFAIDGLRARKAKEAAKAA